MAKAVRVRVWKRQWEYPKGSGKWKEAWTIDYIDRHGKQRRVTPHPDSRDSTRLAADKIRKGLMDKIHVADSDTVTVKQALTEFHAQQRRLGLAGGTLKGMSDCMDKYIIPVLGSKLVADVASEDVEDIVNELIDDGQERTPGLVLSIMRRTLAFCVPRYLVRNVLVDQPITLPAKNEEPIYIPTVEEMRALLGNLEARHNRQDDYEQHYAWTLRKLMVLLGALAGLRRGEMQGLHWQNINANTRMIEVRHSWSPTDGLKGPKTKAGRRDIPLTAPIGVALKPVWELQGRPEKGMIFLTRSGGPAYGCMYESYFKTSMRYAGLLVPREGGGGTDRQRDRGHTPKFSIHALRHWAISSWLLDGVPIPRVSKWAGHASPMVTMKVYARVIESMEQLALDREKLELNGARILGQQSRLLEGPEPEFLGVNDKALTRGG